MRNQWLTVAVIMLSCSISHAQDAMDYGIMHVIHEETREVAGVESFRLRHEGSLTAPREEWTIHAEIFSIDGNLLGEITIRWPNSVTTDVTFIAADTGATYRIVGHDDGSPALWLEFEDQAIGDVFTVRYTGTESERVIYRADDEEVLTFKNKQASQMQWSLDGISQKSNSNMPTYQEVIGVVGMMVLEVETMLGIAPGQQSPRRSLVRSQSRSRSSSSAQTENLFVISTV